MAINVYTKDGYGQIELNQVAWRRDGRIEAQCALSEDFDANNTCENGMLLAIDKVGRKLFRANAANAVEFPVGIHYSTEHLYDERAQGLKNFSVKPGEFLPRVGMPAVGDRFTTNTISYDTAEFINDDAVDAALEDLATPLWAGVSTAPGVKTGYWQLTATKPVIGPVARVFEKTTMPDGQPAVKLHIHQVL